MVQINRALALSYARSPSEALDLIDEAASDGQLDQYQPYYAARADLLDRNGDKEAAKQALLKAVELSDNQAERAFLQAKIADL